jgi:hypothetical protein
MAQGKARNKEETIEALKPYFKMGCSVLKACNYGGIPQSTVQTWIDNDEALRVQVTAWQNEPNVLARTNWIAKMAEGDYNSSKDWISKKEKDEFSDRVEQTGANGEPISIAVETRAAIEKALDDV